MRREIHETVSKIHEFFKNRELTLSVAESCTGGLLSHYITGIAGASAFFIAGIVSYSDDMKKKVLGVSNDTIVHFGVVSDETAKEMAEKVRLLAETDYALSTTGNLGPDCLEGKARGLIYIAASGRGKTICRELRLGGNREENKQETALAAMKLLIELVEQVDKN